VRLTEKLSEEANRSMVIGPNGLWEIEWSRGRRRHVTTKGQGHDLNKLKTPYFDNNNNR